MHHATHVRKGIKLLDWGNMICPTVALPPFVQPGVFALRENPAVLPSTKISVKPPFRVTTKTKVATVNCGGDVVSLYLCHVNRPSNAETGANL